MSEHLSGPTSNNSIGSRKCNENNKKKTWKKSNTGEQRGSKKAKSKVKNPSVILDSRNMARTIETAIGDQIDLISDRSFVAGYNWDPESWIPTIVVPGAPKVFRPWTGGYLKQRDQTMTIDEEAYRIPNAPMDPLFTAVRLCRPDFKISDIDIVADLNCLKKLLRFVVHIAEVNKPLNICENKEQFRIDVHMLGDTAVFRRREDEHHGKARGYGVGYLSACTDAPKDTGASGPYKRVTFVKFGPLRLLLRHKILAAAYPESQKGAGDSSDVKRISDPINKQWPISTAVSNVRFVSGGYQGDPTDLVPIELASLSSDSNVRLVVDKWLDMCFVGSDNLYLGQHQRGRFARPTMKNRREALQLVGLEEEDGQRLLMLLREVLKQVVAHVRRLKRQSSQNFKGKSMTAQIETFSIVSDNDCRKLLLYKHKRDAAAAQAGCCVSETMLRALMGDGQQQQTNTLNTEAKSVEASC